MVIINTVNKIWCSVIFYVKRERNAVTIAIQRMNTYTVIPLLCVWLLYRRSLQPLLMFMTETKILNYLIVLL